MKNLMVIVFAVLAGCADTSDSNSEGNKSVAATINGTWRAVSFENYVDNSVIYLTNENSKGMDITITFDEKADPHKLSGKNTTNDIFGTFEHLKANKVRVINLASTKVAQPEIADEFSRALTSEDLEFDIVKSKLKLYYENKGRSVTLVPN